VNNVKLDRSAIDRVLRRAGELSSPRPEAIPAGEAISEEVVLASAEEVGLDVAAVRVSLAIERLGPTPVPARADRLLGAAEVVIERVLALEANAAIDRLDELMVRQHQLRTKRSRPHAREWHKRKGTVGTVQRVALAVTGDAGLSGVARVVAAASAVDGQRSVVRLAADRRSQRTGIAAGGAVVGGVGVVGVAVLSVLTAPLLLVTTPLVLGAAVGVAAQGRKQAADLARELDAVFDAVEQGTEPVTLTDSLRRVMRGPRSRQRY